MKKETTIWKKKKKNIFLLVFMIFSLLLSFIPFNQDNAMNNDLNSANIQNESLMDEKDNPKLSLPTSNYEWWNKSWNFRIPVDISSTGEQDDAPVELFINFTEYFNEIGVTNPWLDKYSIRVIEYTLMSDYTEINCQFDSYGSYDNETNAIGDVVWILNGTTPAQTPREFFIYFNNGSVSELSQDYYTDLRMWHEGFEEYQIGDILSAGGSGQDLNPTLWEISNATSSRGQSSLHIWGNCWKAESTGGISFDSDPDVRVTVKMRIDDAQIDREIVGLGFHDIPGSIPAQGESYEMRGSQDWGTAEGRIYDDVYYEQNTFFWYTMSVISHDQYIFFIADDDSPTNYRDLYWDDISVWSQVVKTVPDHMLTITTGDIEAISFTLKVITNDEFGDPVPNAHIFISNKTQEGNNDQNHTTNEDGEWIFTEVIKDGLYNITINYTQNGLDTPETETVYYNENFKIKTLSNVLIAGLNLTTIYFNISDFDGDPIQYGHVLIKESGSDVGKGTLNDIGNTTLRWINDTSYNYEVYYNFESRPETATYVDPELKIVNNTLVTGRFVNKPTNVSKVYLNVTEYSAKTPFAYAKVRVFNDTGGSLTESIANITLGADGLATFVYFGGDQGSWGDYELDIFFAGTSRPFHVNDAIITTLTHPFTLNTQFNINLSIELNVDDYNTTIDVISYTSETLWNGNITVTFNFTRHEPPNINTLETPDEIYLQILDEEDGEFSSKISMESYEILTGIFNYTFNTTQYSLIGGTTYRIALTGSYKSYKPAETKISITILGIATDISIHDYDPPHDVLSTVSQNYGENINITIRYFNNQTLIPLDDATLSYQWLSFDYTVVNPDPINIGYYTFLINTGDSGTATPRIISISAKLENYTSQETTFILNILPRPTSINNKTDPLDRTVNIYIQDALNFTYEYRDVLTNEKLGGLDQAYYKWYEMGSGGNIIQGPSNVITLLERNDKVYVLDFSTDTRAVGIYLLRVTFVKTNYETKTQDITLNVLKRTIDVDIDAKGLEDDQLNIVKGKTVTIEVTLTDPTQGDIPITGADVVLEIGGREFDFDEEDDGVYELEFSTEKYEAFFNSETLTGEIIIKKANYETEEEDITIVIEMEEVTEGVPTFYFIMVVAAIAAVLGSLGAYRYIQIARIPTFVKKARKVKKSIKSGDKVAEALLYPSKEAYLAKILGPKYSAVGLSLDDLLGLKGKGKTEDSLKTNGGAK